MAPKTLAARIRAVLPDAFVEQLPTNPGFGPAANAITQFVEGDNGFFCFCHDDVALDPDAVRLMVEELYRSNAGIVGPKLVTWENARVLARRRASTSTASVRPASRVEFGEVDQEQHDAVTDVFAVPSACLLIRADLFGALGGFDSSMTYYGEDVDLCWRAQISGARVMVAPAARVRHRAELEARRPDLDHETLRARHQVRSMLTLTSGPRLPIRLVELIAETILVVVVGVFTRSCPRGVGLGPRRSRRDPALPDAVGSPRRDRQTAPGQRRRGTRSAVAREQPPGVVPACPRDTVGDRRRRLRWRRWSGRVDVGDPTLARTLAGATRHVVGRDRRGARRQSVVHQPVGADHR